MGYFCGYQRGFAASENGSTFPSELFTVYCTFFLTLIICQAQKTNRVNLTIYKINFKQLEICFKVKMPPKSAVLLRLNLKIYFNGNVKECQEAAIAAYAAL